MEDLFRLTPKYSPELQHAQEIIILLKSMGYKVNIRGRFDFEISLEWETESRGWFVPKKEDIIERSQRPICLVLSISHPQKIDEPFYEFKTQSSSLSDGVVKLIKKATQEVPALKGIT